MPAREVHVAWARPGDIAPQDWAELDDGLDTGERERALQFRFEADRHAYVLAHALLRALVAGVAGRPARSVHLEHDARGRPGVEGEPQLNISNTRTRQAVACAVTLAGPVGVDVEAIDARGADAELLASYVASDEAARGREFFERWALLEAFWKAWGTGLAQGNARIVISSMEGGQFDIRTEGGAAFEGTGWVLEPFDDCATALVLRGCLPPSLRLRQTRCNSARDIKQLSGAI